MKKSYISLLIITFLFSASLRAQDQIEWQQIHEQDGISIHYAIGKCGPQHQLLLMFGSTAPNDKKLKVSLQVIDGQEIKLIPETEVLVPAGQNFVLHCQRIMPHLSHLQMMLNSETAECLTKTVSVQDSQ